MKLEKKTLNYNILHDTIPNENDKSHLCQGIIPISIALFVNTPHLNSL